MARKVERKEYAHTCKVCGKQYVTFSPNGFLCSPSCRAAWALNKDYDYGDCKAKKIREQLSALEEKEKAKKNKGKKRDCTFCPLKKSGACKGGKAVFVRTSSGGGVYRQYSDERCDI